MLYSRLRGNDTLPVLSSRATTRDPVFSAVVTYIDIQTLDPGFRRDDNTEMRDAN